MYMPRKTFRKKVKRAPRKRYARKSRTTVRAGKQSPIASRLITKMKYVQSVNSSVPNFGLVNQLFNLNSIFDPDRSGVGHQPYGHDQLALFYSKYRVFAVSWRCMFPTADKDYYVTVTPQNHANVVLNFDENAEQPRAMSKLVSAEGNAVTMTGRMSMPALVGQTPSQYKSDQNFQANFGASPTEIATLRIAFTNQSGVTITIPAVYQLMYHVECFDPLELVQS